MKYRAEVYKEKRALVIAKCGNDAHGESWNVVSDDALPMGAQATAEFIADSLNKRFESWRVPPATEKQEHSVGDNFATSENVVLAIEHVYHDGVQYVYEFFDMGSGGRIALSCYELVKLGWHKLRKVE